MSWTSREFMSRVVPRPSSRWKRSTCMAKHCPHCVGYYNNVGSTVVLGAGSYTPDMQFLLV